MVTKPASIGPDAPSPPTVYSKYVVNSTFGSDDLPVRLNINADVAIVTFSGPKLTMTYKYEEDLTGFTTFRGVIGAGTIRFTTGAGVEFSGPIEKGPKGKQSFVGTGTWTTG